MLHPLGTGKDRDAGKLRHRVVTKPCHSFALPFISLELAAL